VTQNSLLIFQEIVAVVAGAVVLLIFALALGIPPRHAVPPGFKGHREGEEEGESEVVRADGYIDSFAGVIEEAGGSLPLIVRIAIPGILLWWLIYMIYNWQPRYFLMG
jgi:hypothetical protein